MPKNQKGFSLAEVLIALSIVIFASAILIGLYNSAQGRVGTAGVVNHFRTFEVGLKSYVDEQIYATDKQFPGVDQFHPDGIMAKFIDKRLFADDADPWKRKYHYAVTPVNATPTHAGDFPGGIQWALIWSEGQVPDNNKKTGFINSATAENMNDLASNYNVQIAEGNSIYAGVAGGFSCTHTWKNNTYSVGSDSVFIAGWDNDGNNNYLTAAVNADDGRIYYGNDAQLPEKPDSSATAIDKGHGPFNTNLLVTNKGTVQANNSTPYTGGAPEQGLACDNPYILLQLNEDRSVILVEQNLRNVQ